jgi:hypothetical protein
MFYTELAPYAQPNSRNVRSVARCRFQDLRLKARFNRVLSLFGQKHALKHLSSAGHPRCAGLHTVAIDKITGSESRTGDFDRDFNPLKDNTLDRWVSVMTARLSGVSLPPVDLLKAGDEYYVRDGHHRISVARALGEGFIEAQITSVE